MTDVRLSAKTARQARSEISSRWPTIPVAYTGYAANGEAVLLSLVREKGNIANVATARRNKAPPAVYFVAHLTD